MIVTEVVTAMMATIVISHGNNAKISLKAQGEVGVSNLNLVNLDANFQISNESYIATKIITSKNLTPLFKTSGIRKRWPGKSIFLNSSTNNVTFGRLDYSDYDTDI